MVLPSSARGCLCHPSGLLWFHGFWRTFAAAGCVPSVMSQPQKQDCHTLQRVDLARPFLVSPAIKIEIENSLEMALSKAKSGSAWQSHFWQCGTVEPCDLLETRSSLHYANKSKLGFVYAASFQRNWGGPPLGVQILYTFPSPKMGIKQIEQFSDIILRILRFLAESSGVTKLELFQPFPHCK